MLIKKLLAFITSIGLVLTIQPALANTNLNLSMLCNDGTPRDVFSLPYSGWVLVRNSANAPVAGQVVNMSVTGAAALEFPQGLITDASGYLYYNVTPTLGAPPQDIVVTAQIPNSNTNMSCRTKSMTWKASSIRVSLDGPSEVSAGSSATFTLSVNLINGLPMPRIPITWQHFGPGLVIPAHTRTDSQGQAKITVLFASNEQGLMTLVASMNFGTGLGTVTKNVQVKGVPQPVVQEAEIYTSEQRVFVAIKNAKGTAVSVKIDSRWFRFTATSDVHIFQTPATAETQNVAAYINGQLMNVATLSIVGFEKPSPKPTPRTTPTAQSARTPSSTVTCRSGQKVLTVTGIKPTCPSGFKVSKQAMPASAKTVTCKKPGFTIRMAKPMTTCPAGYRK
jgi:hypothetical protein